MAYVEDIKNTTGYDELIAGHSGAGRKIAVKLKKGLVYERGMLLTATDGVCAPTQQNKVADYVFYGDKDKASHNVDTTEAAADDTVGLVYEDGIFHRDKVKVADGDTVEAHEAELRPKNILFTKLMDA